MVHVPYASWCPICIGAKARDMEHYARSELPVSAEMLDEHEVIEMDYAVTGDETILAIYSVTRQAGHATVVDKKGPTAWATSWIIKKLAVMGTRAIRL